MNLEESIRAIVAQELDKRDLTPKLTPQDQFCKDKNLSRTSLWRGRRSGQIQDVKIGRKVFISESQFGKK